MDERHEELAALNAFGMLESDEKRVLNGAGVADKELRDFSVELEQTAAELARLITPVEPPADMKRRIRAKLRSSGAKGAGFSRGVVLGGTGWALAAALAVAAVWLWQDREKLVQQVAAVSRAMAPAAPSVPVAETAKKETRNIEDELKSLRSDFEAKKAALSTEIAEISKRETEANAHIAKLVADAEAQKQQAAQSQLQIATLQSKIWEYRNCKMVVVWDGGKRQGVLLLDKMPRVESGQDYQLWVVDPNQPDLVSAGVVTVDAKGAAKTAFKPVAAVGETVTFALSVEKTGGVPKNEGPIVLTGP
ncbi:MAG: anti-sigma factor domain-containing protein [Prosthecobacter sp.]|uniref:anti-sigma factor domain-containing protein n=1 Tax=Prosthecobacter sp. TaxID=1965333 RepID=UPI0039017480